jgi:hypothetical protein
MPHRLLENGERFQGIDGVDLLRQKLSGAVSHLFTLNFVPTSTIHTLQTSITASLGRRGSVIPKELLSRRVTAAWCFADYLGRELIKHPGITLLMQLNKGYVVRCQIVIERRDSPTLFDLIEESLD